MSRDVLRAIALGIGGLVVALVLTLGAFAIAGQDISEPAGVPMLTVTPSSTASEHDTGDDERSPDPRETASPSVDDHGGSGSDDGGATATEGPDDRGANIRVWLPVAEPA